MLNRLFGMLRWVLAEFGPLVVFWARIWRSASRWRLPARSRSFLRMVRGAGGKGLAFTKDHFAGQRADTVFGTIDLLSATPFMLKYEAIITNVVTGGFFVLGARGPRPIIQELAEQRSGEDFSGRADVVRFFQIFTLAWAGVFDSKAGFYFAVGQMLPMVEAIAVRTVVGSASMALMVALSFSQGRRLFFLCQRLGLLPIVVKAGP